MDQSTSNSPLSEKSKDARHVFLLRISSMPNDYNINFYKISLSWSILCTFIYIINFTVYFRRLWYIIIVHWIVGWFKGQCKKMHCALWPQGSVFGLFLLICTSMIWLILQIAYLCRWLISYKFLITHPFDHTPSPLFPPISIYSTMGHLNG